MSDFFLRNKSRSCTIGLPPEFEGKTGHGFKRAEIGGRILVLGPGDVGIFADGGILRLLQTHSRAIWVHCADPKEAAELEVPVELSHEIDKDGHVGKFKGGFFGAGFIVEDYTDEGRRLVGSTAQRLAAQKRLDELETLAIEATEAKQALARVESEKAAQRAQIEALKQELAAVRVAGKAK